MRYIVGFVVALPFAIFVARDAKKRQMNSTAWTIATFLALLFAFPLYLAARTEYPPDAARPTRPLSQVRDYSDLFSRARTFCPAFLVALIAWQVAIPYVRVFTCMATGLKWDPEFFQPEQQLSMLVRNVVSGAILSFGLLWASRAVRSKGWLILVAGCVYAFASTWGYVSSNLAFERHLTGDSFTHAFDTATPFLVFSGLVWGVFVFGSILLAVRLWGVRPLVVIPACGIGSVLYLCLSLTGGKWLLSMASGVSVGGTLNAESLLMIFYLGLTLGLAIYGGMRFQHLRNERAPLPAPSSGRISTSFFFACFALLHGIGIPLAWGRASAKGAASLPYLVLDGAILLFGIIAMLVLIYRMWAAIDDGHSKTSPGEAAGLLFVPVFNIYWLFRALPGFTNAYNLYVQRHDLPAGTLRSGVFIAFCLFSLLAAIPFVGLAMELPLAILGIVMVARICNAVNALPLNAAEPVQAGTSA